MEGQIDGGMIMVREMHMVFEFICTVGKHLCGVGVCLRVTRNVKKVCKNL